MPNYFTTFLTTGKQVISFFNKFVNCYFSILQNETESTKGFSWICLTRHFFGEVKARQFCFEIYWPLVKHRSISQIYLWDNLVSIYPYVNQTAFAAMTFIPSVLESCESETEFKVQCVQTLFEFTEGISLKKYWQRCPTMEDHCSFSLLV